MAESNVTEKKRIDWIDIAKLIGIYLVIVGHVRHSDTGITNFVHRAIYGFHMPLFFFLSGYVHKKESFQITLKKAAKNILLPYFSLTLICTLLMIPYYWEPIESVTKTIIHNFITPIIGIFFSGNYGFPKPFGYCRFFVLPMWFLFALFECKIICSITYKKIQYIIPIILLAISYFLSVYKIEPWFRIGCCCMSYIFYFIGYKIKEKNLLRNNYVVLKFILSLIAYVVLQIFTNDNIVFVMTIDFGGSGIKYLLLYLLKGLLGIYMVINFSMLLKSNSFVNYYARNTIIILPFHFVIVFYLQKLFENLVFNNIFLELLYSFGIMIVCTVPIFVINHYFPALIGKKKVKEIQ